MLLAYGLLALTQLQCFSSYCPYCLYTVVDDLLAIGLLGYWAIGLWIPMSLLIYCLTLMRLD